MDNIIITSNDNSQISNLVTTFKVTFELKYFSILNYFLGIQIIRTEYGLTLTQSNYTSDILHRFNMHNAKPVKTPCCPFTWLVPNASHTLSDPAEYCNLVGALQYLKFTWPDLAFSVLQLCQFSYSPNSVHLEAVKCVLRYLRGTLHHGVYFSPSPFYFISFLWC